MRGSRNAVSLAATCTRRGDWVNQAEHLDARVAKAPEGIGRAFETRQSGESRASTQAAASLAVKPNSPKVGYGSTAVGFTVECEWR
jgi:hypothetical protein